MWDAEHHLVEVKQGPATLASFTYDGLGRRAQKIASGVTHISDEDSLIEGRLSTEQTLRYVEGPSWPATAATVVVGAGSSSRVAQMPRGAVGKLSREVGAVAMTWAGTTIVSCWWVD